MRKTILKRALTLLAAAAVFATVLFVSPKQAQAKVYVLPDGTVFDSDFYASIYPEMQAGYANGKYPERLLWHYITYGVKEGRVPSLYSMYNPTPATMSTPYVYPAGTCNVIPWESLYPYYPYIY
ncbi:MAG: hypothetical protein K6E63_03675 [Lachnospiraceae bacterium]|nr:hypothetical protein [Lachnospiraceae bacterium]